MGNPVKEDELSPACCVLPSAAAGGQAAQAVELYQKKGEPVLDLDRHGQADAPHLGEQQRPGGGTDFGTL